ncbi:MAG: pyruvate synthase subunit beta [Planctomycetes bacterium]|nr:pyruvate synthase subunit beta [Planctomycetota bacterium]
MRTDCPDRPHFRLPNGGEIVSRGHLACPGCGIMPAIRFAMKVLGRRTVIVAPACCYAVVDGPFPYSAAGVPFLHSAFEAAASFASGVRAGLDTTGVADVTVLAWAGDGGTFDIGLQSLSAAAERNENMIYVCYDNEAYMNTGIQRSSATPRGAWTTTTPKGATKTERKKDLGAIMAAHRVPYFATATIAYLEDLTRKFAKARDLGGFRMLHLYAPCPTGWKADARHMVELSRLAVRTRVFPLYEVHDGTRFEVTLDPETAPLRDYLALQGRFAEMGDAGVAAMEDEIRDRWEILQRRAASSGRA